MNTMLQTIFRILSNSHSNEWQIEMRIIVMILSENVTFQNEAECARKHFQVYQRQKDEKKKYEIEENGRETIK